MEISENYWEKQNDSRIDNCFNNRFLCLHGMLCHRKYKSWRHYINNNGCNYCIADSDLRRNRMIINIIEIIICHIVGDYLLQTDYMAKEKNNNLYILFVHCVCYCIPFIYIFGFNYKIISLLIIHMVIDWMKIHHYINIAVDQIAHYVFAIVIFLT